MENIKSANEGISAIKKPSILENIENQLIRLDDEVEKTNKKKKGFIEKNKGIIIIIIAVISIFITVKVTYNSISLAPIQTISEDNAISIITELYSSVWEIDRGINTLPEEFKNQIYAKIEFSNHLLNDGLTLPIKFYKNDNASILGVEVGYISYNREQKIIDVILPNTKTLKFLYSSASKSNMENITIIGDDNNRCYFTKKVIQ